MTGLSLIAVNVGNSRTQIGRFVEGDLAESRRIDNGKRAEIVQLVMAWWQQMATVPQASVLLASVNDAVAGPLEATLEDQLSIEVYRVGDDIPVPIGRQLDPETITGTDRLLNAAAAYDRIQQACIVIDAGTALTVDFVDGEGTFHGGAIVPGAAAQLKAMHDQTASLPELQFTAPDNDAFGRSTGQAMLHGVFHGIRGAVQRFVERYSERYGAFPPIIATGGDAEVLFEHEELIDHIVPDLTILGIAATARQALAGGEVEGPDGRL
ncbi:MAG: type III pantothenate kinase [Planctomycetota bacterium]|jgi:type III pantothenate kinase